MAPTSRLLLTRHAQAEHNVALDYSSTPPSPKTLLITHPNSNLSKKSPTPPSPPLATKQATSLAPQLSPLHPEISLIVTSPLTRTLQTSLLAWGPAIERLGRENLICLPEAQECNAFPCDTGSSRESLAANPEFEGLDFSRLHDDWTSKKGFWAADDGALDARAAWVRRFLRDRPEGTIVLVAHGDVLRRITGDARGPSGHMWRNAEVREFAFDPKSVERDGECWLVERGVEAVAGGYGPTSTEADLA